MGNPTAKDFFAAGIFEEPLAPLTPPTPGENADLASALQAFLQRPAPTDFGALEQFVAGHPNSPWRFAVLVNLGLLHYGACNFSKTFPVWEEAWQLGKSAREPRAKALADRAIGELIRMNARVGRMGRLDALLEELGDRPLVGAATEMVAGARRGLWRMKHSPAQSFRCGPLALDRLLASADPHYAMDERIFRSESTTNGWNLQQVWDLSKEVNLKMQPAKRAPGAKIMFPAVIHWKVGHYAALIREDKGRFLIKDPTFGPDLWASRETIDQEASGYFLVESRALPPGWSQLSAVEAATVFGKGDTDRPPRGYPQPPPRNFPPWPPTPPDPRPKLQDPKPDPAPQTCGPMTVASFDPVTVSLILSDTPVRYNPPRGPAVEFKVNYQQREGGQPGNFAFANFGPKWTFNWISYVNDDPSNPAAEVNVYLPGGGADFFSGFDPATQSFLPEPAKRTVLKRTSDDSYALVFPDGSQHIFNRPVGVAGPRRIFLTRMLDPQGNAVELAYDARQRLVAVQDSLGQVSTVSYEWPEDDYKVTRITDPFGRQASFDYDASGRLTNITDVIGIRSTFTYEGGSDFIKTLATPYGVSQFRIGEDGVTRWLEMTDPEGATERVEFRNQAPGLAFQDPAEVPAGVTNPFNQYMWSRNTFYWDKNAFRLAVGDYTRAQIFHWMHDVNPTGWRPILESQKAPLENRVWFSYPNQVKGAFYNEGMIAKPSRVARVLDDGSTQLFQYEYNAFGNVTRQVDPMGRATTYLYATNQVDLIQVRQSGAVDELLKEITYNDQHLPLTTTDGSGRMYRFTYNAAGQVLTLTNPRNDVTTYGYNEDGYLMSIDGPLPGPSDTMRFTYDLAGRLQSVTDSEGYTLTYEHDGIDRLTRTTFPDGTFEEKTYSRLDQIGLRDRLGRVTQYGYDGNRHLTSVEDPLHRIVRYDWCSCGSLGALIDPMGRTTRWNRDLQGRIIAKEYVDGSKILYAYEATTSRLKTVTDEKGQIKRYAYGLDNNLLGITYLKAENPTPNVTFTYDPHYDRIQTMQDGIGLTTYGYHPASVNGGALAFVDGPLGNDTVTYDYDALGRVKTRAIDGVAQRWDFDPLGRVSVVTNVLGAFTNTYVNATYRPASVNYPNGQRTEYSYYDNAGDQRLEEIKNLGPARQEFSKFSYAYNPVGQITVWNQQQLGAVTTNSYAYDAANQLVWSTRIGADGQVQDTAYAYDLAGNRLLEQVGSTNRVFSYNALNQIVSAEGGLELTNRTYRWDAENRLVAIIQGDHRTGFAYDGVGRRSRIMEKDNGVSIVDSTFLWCGDIVCEERNAESGAVTQRFFQGQGQQKGAQILYYSKDHLGSVRELRDRVAVLQTAYSYDAYGRMTRLVGLVDTSFGFTGHFVHSATSLTLTRFRVYDSKVGQWLSRDPISNAEELQEGPNLFSYVANDPINSIDRFGLKRCPDGYVHNPAQSEKAFYDAFISLKTFNPFDAAHRAELKYLWDAYQHDSAEALHPGSEKYGHPEDRK